MEVDSLPTLNRKASKKHRNRSDDINDKKRKHKLDQHASGSQSTKKHHKRQHTFDAAFHDGSESSILQNTSSPFHELTSSLCLPLPPIGHKAPLQTLCAEHISPLLLTYFTPFHGYILSWSNPRLSSSPEDISSTDGRQKVYARAINECAAPFVWLTADFLVLNPQRGDICEGYIVLQNESNISLVCWNFFSASVERRRLPRDWRWISNEKFPRKRKQKLKRPSQTDEMDIDTQSSVPDQSATSFADDEGYWQDGNGKRVSGTIQFRVTDVNSSSGVSRDFNFMSIIGTMLDDEQESRLWKGELSADIGSPEHIREGLENGEKDVAAGRSVNGYDGSMDVETEANMPMKHRVKY